MIKIVLEVTCDKCGAGSNYFNPSTTNPIEDGKTYLRELNGLNWVRQLEDSGYVVVCPACAEMYPMEANHE